MPFMCVSIFHQMNQQSDMVMEGILSYQYKMVACLCPGFGRCLVYRKQTVVVKRYANQTYDKVMGPTMDRNTNKFIWKHEPLDTDGIVCAGERVENRQVLVNKAMPTVTIPSSKTPDLPSDTEYKEVPVT